MRILVIRHGALGDLFLSFGPFAAIRARHAADRITLLTTAPFAEVMTASPWFDRVEIDARPAAWDLPGLWRLRRQLAGFDLVYDLQTSARSTRYHALAGRPDWSGIARGCRFPDAPGRDALHTLDRQRGQLLRAGVARFPPPALDWLRDGEGAPGVAPPIGPGTLVLVPGAAPHRPAKRWPAARFAALAARMRARGWRPAVVGGAADRALAREIADAAPGTLDLSGRTTIAGLAAVMGRAGLAVGNDTGPMHVAAAMGCRTVVLFSGDSDPALTAPRAADDDPERVRVVRRDPLDRLSVDTVAAMLPDPPAPACGRP